MASSDSGEKTEDATPQRREDFRKRGQVAQTKELATVLMLLASVFGVWVMGSFLMQNLVEVFQNSLGSLLVQSVREGQWRATLVYVAKEGAIIVAPLMGLFMFIAFASSVFQVGFLYNEEALQLKLERMNPLSGLKRVFSLKALVEGIKSMIKVACVSVIVYFLLKSEVKTLPRLVYFSVGEIIHYLGVLSFKLFMGVGVFMGVVAALDYFFQRYQLEEEMKMTKQEVKEEHKSREGDPLIKSRIRRVQREMATRRMMEDVPKADVIVTNPTHIAIALKYDSGMVAPKVIAKGADLIAEKIKSIAKENRIPIVENKPLARTIYKTIKIGQIIPRELYTAVAEVLSYVYKLKRKGRAK